MSYEYIRGLIEGEGCFSFCQSSRKPDGRKYKVPAFEIAMHERDRELLIKVRDFLKLRNRVYILRNPDNGITKTKKRVVLIVREFLQLKDIIVPLFYKKLHGHKGKQFEEWLLKIGSDPDVSERFKSIYRLYKWGVYDKEEFISRYV